MKHNSGVHNIPIHAPNPLAEKTYRWAEIGDIPKLIYNKHFNAKWAEINIYFKHLRRSRPIDIILF